MPGGHKRVSPRDRYKAAKQHAKDRGIVWLFTFETWWQMWESSGKWHKRGVRPSEYCMARGTWENPDVGPYSPWNVRIITNKENRAERIYETGVFTFSHTSTAKEKMRQSKLGKPLSAAHRKSISMGHKGKTMSKTHRKKISAAMKRFSSSPEGRALRVVAAKVRWGNAT